jgi:hypothetical protein
MRWDVYASISDRDQYRRDHWPEQKGGGKARGFETQGEEPREDDQEYPSRADNGPAE